MHSLGIEMRGERDGQKMEGGREMRREMREEREEMRGEREGERDERRGRKGGGEEGERERSERREREDRERMKREGENCYTVAAICDTSMATDSAVGLKSGSAVQHFSARLL